MIIFYVVFNAHLYSLVEINEDPVYGGRISTHGPFVAHLPSKVGLNSVGLS